MQGCKPIFWTSVHVAAAAQPQSVMGLPKRRLITAMITSLL